MSSPQSSHTTASHPTGITPQTTTTTSTATSPTRPTTTTATPTKTTPHAPIPQAEFLHPTPIPAPGMRGGLFPRYDHPTPAMPQPGAVPFLPKETGTGPSSRASSVNPNDTLPPTPTLDQPQPYPPQMRMPILTARDIPRSTMPLPPGAVQEVRPTTHLQVEDDEKVLPTPTEYHNALPSRPVQEQGYTARRVEGQQGGYRQNEAAMERPRYYEGREEEEKEETLLGKLGKWVEGINNKIVETGITGDGKDEGKGKGKGKE